MARSRWHRYCWRCWTHGDDTQHSVLHHLTCKLPPMMHSSLIHVMHRIVSHRITIFLTCPHIPSCPSHLSSLLSTFDAVMSTPRAWQLPTLRTATATDTDTATRSFYIGLATGCVLAGSAVCAVWWLTRVRGKETSRVVSACSAAMLLYVIPMCFCCAAVSDVRSIAML